MDQQQFMALIAKTQPTEYVQGLLAGDGGELLYAAAKIAERVSLAVQRLLAGLTAGTAPLGACAAGTVVFSRAGTAAGGLAAGTLLSTLAGEPFALASAVAWDEGNSDDQQAQVQALARGYRCNLLPGTPLIVVGAQPAPLWDPTLLCHVVTLAGGVDPMLEDHAWTKGTAAQPGETAQALRRRLIDLDDVLTPKAVRRQIAAIMPTARMVEGWELAAYSDGAFYTDGAASPVAKTARGRLDNAAAGQASFMIVVPPPVAPPASTGWLFAGGYTDRCCALRRCTLTGPAGQQYDAGQVAQRQEVRRLAAQVKATKADGVRWWIEEARP